MFGYINANYRELNEEQKAKYQAYYCGLCRALKRNFGKRGQILLNYDMAFLVLVLTGLYEPKEEETDFTCGMHPLQKKHAILNEVSDYAAKMNVVLAYHNAKDDWLDERSVSKRLLMKLLEEDYKKIAAEYPRQTLAVENAMKKLMIAEIGKESNLDAVSGITGEMLAEIFNWKDDHWADELRCMGFYIGKFVYLLDAYHDLQQDTKHGRYNPYIYNQMEDKSKMELEVYVKLVLSSMMAECAKSFERLPIIEHADLIRNILYSGVWTKYEMLQLKKEAEKKKGKADREKK